MSALSAIIADLAGDAIAEGMGVITSAGLRQSKKALKGVFEAKLKTPKRGRGRPKGSKNKRKPRTKGSAFHESLSHRALANNYNYNNLSYCVTENLGMYNSPRAVVNHTPALLPFVAYHDTFTITNNGVMPGTGAEGPAIHTGSDRSYYNNLDFTHALGKWHSTGAAPGGGGALQSDQIFDLRSQFKKWKKAHLKLTIKWDSKIDNLHALSVPEGFYMIVQRQNIKTMLSASGAILADESTDNQIYRIDTQKLSEFEVLARKYGRPTRWVSDVTVAGEFPGEAAAVLLNPVPQEIMTYENLGRNSAGWKKIPRSRTLVIDIPYKTGYGFTTNNNVFTDPVILFVFKEVPPSWMTQVTNTTGTGTASGGTTTFDLDSQPQFSNEIVVAKIADVKVLHCYKFKDRCEDLVEVTPGYSPQDILVPY